MHLLALQDASPPDAVARTWAIIAVIVALLLLFVAFIFRVIFKQIGKNRELAHLERMKALDLGRPTGPSEAEKCLGRYLHNVFWISFWIGCVVPISAASAAATIITREGFQDFAVILAIWVCAAVISVASVICATTLMISSRHRSSKGVIDPAEKQATGAEPFLEKGS